MTEKLKLELISPEMTRALAQVLTMGADKHGPRGWEAGLDEDANWGSIGRHILAHKLGTLYDDESGLLHLKHAMTRLGMEITIIERRLREYDGLAIMAQEAQDRGEYDTSYERQLRGRVSAKPGGFLKNMRCCGPECGGPELIDD